MSPQASGTHAPTPLPSGTAPPSHTAHPTVPSSRSSASPSASPAPGSAGGGGNTGRVAHPELDSRGLAGVIVGSLLGSALCFGAVVYMLNCKRSMASRSSDGRADLEPRVTRSPLVVAGSSAVAPVQPLRNLISTKADKRSLPRPVGPAAPPPTARTRAGGTGAQVATKLVDQPVAPEPWLRFDTPANPKLEISLSGSLNGTARTQRVKFPWF